MVTGCTIGFMKAKISRPESQLSRDTTDFTTRFNELVALKLNSIFRLCAWTLLASLLLAACGGSSSESPYPLEPSSEKAALKDAEAANSGQKNTKNDP